MNATTKKNLAELICKVLFPDGFICADSEGEERDPEGNGFERLGYVKMDFRTGTEREPVTVYFNDKDEVEMQWMNYGVFNDKYPLSGYLMGLMVTVGMIGDCHLKMHTVSQAERCITFGVTPKQG